MQDRRNEVKNMLDVKADLEINGRYLASRMRDCAHRATLVHGHYSTYPILIHNSILLCLSRCEAAVHKALGGGVEGVYGGSCF